MLIFSRFFFGRLSVWEFSKLWSFLNVIRDLVKVMLLMKVFRKIVVLWILLVGLLVKRFILVRYLVMVVRIVVRFIKLWKVVISWGRLLIVMWFDMIVFMVFLIFIMVVIWVNILWEGVRVFIVVFMLIFILMIFRK